jgi:hypothetical protein
MFQCHCLPIDVQIRLLKELTADTATPCSYRYLAKLKMMQGFEPWPSDTLPVILMTETENLCNETSVYRHSEEETQI